MGDDQNVRTQRVWPSAYELGWILGIGTIAFFVILAIWSMRPPGRSTAVDTATSPPGATREPGQSPAATLATVAPTDTPSLESDARLEGIAASQFEGTNNRDVPYLRDVTVISQAGGGYAVTIDFNAADNFGNDFIRRGIEIEMREAYQALFTSGEDVREVWIGAYFPLIDNLGNESDELIYRTTLDRAVADDINWANAIVIEWPDVWTTTQLHPALLE